MNSRNSSTSLLRRTSRWCKMAFCTAALALTGADVLAQANSYSFTATTGTYTDIPAGAPAVDLPLVLADTYLSPAQPIGFTFVYEGISYTQFKMGSNGIISLNMAGTATLTTNDLSAANATSRPILAPLWDDLDGAVSTPLQAVARYSTTGVSPNQVLTVEWRNWQWNWSATGNTVSFQMKLYETSGVIEYLYRQEAGTVNSGSASIGIGSATGIRQWELPEHHKHCHTEPSFQHHFDHEPQHQASHEHALPFHPSGTLHRHPGREHPRHRQYVLRIHNIAYRSPANRARASSFAWEESDDNNTGDPGHLWSVAAEQLPQPTRPLP